MRKLLILLLASLALPTAVNTGSYWLILRIVNSLEKIEMESMEQCEKQGSEWLSKSFLEVWKKSYQCLEG